MTAMTHGPPAPRLSRLLRRARLLVRHRCAFDNIFHCCVQRTASRWVRKVLRDERVFRACGLEHHDLIARAGLERAGITEISFDDPAPAGTIVGPIYSDLRGFLSIPKPHSYRAFFVMRDPRDIVVSWYYAMRFSHQSMDGFLDAIRQELSELSEPEGFRHAIWALTHRARLFQALESWIEAPSVDPNVLLVRYKDLTGDQAEAEWSRLFEHCDIRMSSRTLSALLADHSFERLSGRSRGHEDVAAHLRKGQYGDWRNHLDTDLLDYLADETNDLAARLGYR